MFLSCSYIRVQRNYCQQADPSALRPWWASCLSWIIFERSDIQSPGFVNGSVEDAVDFLLTKFQNHEGIFVGIMNLQS